MPPARKRKFRSSTTDSLAILNGINKRGNAEKRRQTTNDATIYDVPPDSPEPPSMMLRSEARIRDPVQSAPEASRSDQEHNASLSDDEGAYESSRSNQDHAPGYQETEGENAKNNGQENGEDRETNGKSGKGNNRGTEEEVLDDPTHLQGSDNLEDQPSVDSQATSPGSSTSQQPEPTSHQVQASFDVSAQWSDRAESVPRNTVQVVINNSNRNLSGSRGAGETSQDPSNDLGHRSETQHTRPDDAHDTSVSSYSADSHNESLTLDPHQAMESQADSTLNELDRWFLKEVDNSPFREQWRFLRLNGKGLWRRVSGPLPRRLQTVHNLIIELQSTYTALTETSDSPLQVQNLNESIYVEIKGVLDFPDRKSKTNPTTAFRQMLQVEGHIMPRLVILIQCTFRVYRKLGVLAYDSLHSSLELLFKCCKRIYDLWNCGFLGNKRPRPRSLMLLPGLRRLREALENDTLNGNPIEETEVPPNAPPLPQNQSAEPWTGEEEHYLSIGLERYSGSNRYVLIKRHIGHYLPQRTIKELEIKAKELQRGLARSYTDQSSMPSWLQSI
ncbi:uncharacterized protein N7459_004143 [Penicillium hispanicum]|uniref:uncharacterized protein n=1 Tax=Penicillium hispanicum TaxID=1080232 RepID=UPI002541447C|nr:uncharacterized protein N7459_004143 [Penicillium hispanicum]KAJ5584343.1 hypothetical protein N7459_004143 [Penicillium hispanicum]